MIRIALVLTLVVLGGCFWASAGQDSIGRHLKAESERVVLALKSYRAKFGHLPDRLDLLTPKFLSAAPPVEIQYDAVRRSINFSYSPPKISRAYCSTSVERIDWNCGGIY